MRAVAIVALALAACGPGDGPRAEADRLAQRVQSGELDDCEALARFMETAASVDALLEALNHFIPRGKANYPLGRPIGLVGVRLPVKLEGAVSGYRPEFRKEYEPGRPEGTPHDQAHHFAPYFILGARVPKSLALQFLEWAERPESWGDLNLGREAIELGAAASSQGWSTPTLAAHMRNRLCEGAAAQQ